LHDIPVFDLVEQALAVGPVDTTIILPLTSAGCGLGSDHNPADYHHLSWNASLDMVYLLRKTGNRNPGSWTEQSGYHCAGKILLGTHAGEFYTPDQ